MRRWGTSGQSSRLFLKSMPIYAALEGQISATLSLDKTLTFASGYQTNISVISSLLNPKVLKSKPLVFCDRLIHASVYQGLKTAGIHPHRFHHQNLTHLESLLAPFQHDSRPKFIIAETLYSMEGTKTDLYHLNQLAIQHDALLYLDEAHALGVCGPNGYGLSCGVTDPSRTIVMGTFSKGLGASGGFISGPAIVIDYLINACSGFIYTTAIPPANLASALAGWDLLPFLNKQRHHISTLATSLWEGLKDIGFSISPAVSHIIPIILKTPELALEAQWIFKEYKMDVSAIRYPTVPMGQARLRLSLNEGLTQKDVDLALMIAKKHIFPMARGQK